MEGSCRWGTGLANHDRLEVGTGGIVGGGFFLAVPFVGHGLAVVIVGRRTVGWCRLLGGRGSIAVGATVVRVTVATGRGQQHECEEPGEERERAPLSSVVGSHDSPCGGHVSDHDAASKAKNNYSVN